MLLQEIGSHVTGEPPLVLQGIQALDWVPGYALNSNCFFLSAFLPSVFLTLVVVEVVEAMEDGWTSRGKTERVV